jgi:hypothetical protein
VIPELRREFNEKFDAKGYANFFDQLSAVSGGPVQFRVAETPIFLPRTLLQQMAQEGAAITRFLVADSAYLEAARRSIPAGFDVAGQTGHPHFLTADFALVRAGSAGLEPRLVEIQAFPSVFAYQVELCETYRTAFNLSKDLGIFLGEIDGSGYWELLGETVLGRHRPEDVVITEVDPAHQKTFPDFYLMSQRFGIATVDIAAVEPIGDKLHYRDKSGQLRPIHRIYNRAIADELIAKNIKLRFDLRRDWDVEWAGHPNWYFLISKYSIPWLTRSGRFPSVPPAVFVDDFLQGPGEEVLAASGVPLPAGKDDSTVYAELLLKPLFSFAGKGIEFEPTRGRLKGISPAERSSYMVQQRMRFEPTIETPCGLTQAEIRILYVWPDGGELTPVLPLVRLGRGKMMGVDHNKDQEWVGGSAAFYV